MSTVMRFLWMVTLVAFAGGCSSYRVASFPGIQEEADDPSGQEASVKAGETVRITMDDSSQVEGRVASISSTAVSLEPTQLATYDMYVECKGALAAEYRPRVIEADSIRVIEVKGVNVSPKTSAFVLAGFLVGSVVAALATVDLSLE